MTDKPYPFTPEQEAWLRDLETTEEPQTNGWLHKLITDEEGTAGYCCLGRACVVLGIPEIFEENDDFSHFGEERVETWMPQEGTTRLRLRSNGGTLHEPLVIDPSDGRRLHSLTDMNDSDWSFKAIAAYIRANPENVFLPPEEEKS